MEARRLAGVEAVPADGTTVYRVARDGEVREVLLTRLDDGDVAVWENHCQHWTDVRLDRGGGAATRGDELLCRKHGAMFDAATGVCTWGPCEGARLEPVGTVVEDGAVYLDEPGWRVVGPGVEEEDGTNDARGGLDL